MVLESFLHNNSKAFLDVVNRWSAISPPLFNQQLLLQKLEIKNANSSIAISDTMISNSDDNNNYNNDNNNNNNNNSNDTDMNSPGSGTGNGRGDGTQSRDLSTKGLKIQKWHLIEAQAQLYVVVGEHEKALNCYLNVKRAYTDTAGELDEDENRVNESNLDTDIACSDRNTTNSYNNDSSNGVSKNTVKKHPYRHVFDLIQREVSNLTQERT